MTILNYYPVQKALHEKIIQNNQLMVKVNAILDHLPQNANFPFITMDDPRGVHLSNLAKNGVEYEFTLNIWSREAGNKQAAEIMELVYELLHNGTIAVTGKTFVAMQITETSIRLENDGETYHGTMKVKILLMDN